MRPRNEHPDGRGGDRFRPASRVTCRPAGRRRGRAVAVLLAACAAVALATVAAGAQEPAEPPGQPSAAALENPVEATRASLATGRQRYVFLCRQCHGNRGAGDGDMAHAGGIPSDFTDDVWDHGDSDGEIFTVIRDGVSADMQGYANRLSDEDIWHLVNYIRSLSR